MVNDPVNLIDPWGYIGAFPSLDAIADTVGAVGDFLGNYLDMRKAWTQGADKYFHCKANCEAAKRGLAGEGAAENMSEARELTDQYLKGDEPKDCDEDRKANAQGRDGANSNDSCRQVCSSLRPRGLDPYD